jgi:hypothetical protein
MHNITSVKPWRRATRPSRLAVAIVTYFAVRRNRKITLISLLHKNLSSLPALLYCAEQAAQ